MRLLGFAFLIVFSLPHLAADFPYAGDKLQGTVWQPRSSIIDGIPQPEKARDLLLNELIARAREYFSSMIYGYFFEYRPLDQARQKKEFFTLKDLGKVPFGSKGLSYVESSNGDNTILLTLAYEPNIKELSSLKSWQSAALPDASGFGIADFLQNGSNDALSLQNAFELALKESVRQLGRSLSKNKPDRIIGKLVLTKFPKVSIDSGKWRVEIEVRIKLESIEPYENF